MTRVPAYHGHDSTTAVKCRHGMICTELGSKPCKFYGGIAKDGPRGIGPVIVLCSAPAKKGKGTR